MHADVPPVQAALEMKDGLQRGMSTAMLAACRRMVKKGRSKSKSKHTKNAWRQRVRHVAAQSNSQILMTEIAKRTRFLVRLTMALVQ
jgi:hypothetical protein